MNKRLQCCDLKSEHTGALAAFEIGLQQNVRYPSRLSSFLFLGDRSKRQNEVTSFSPRVGGWVNTVRVWELVLSFNTSARPPLCLLRRQRRPLVRRARPWPLVKSKKLEKNATRSWTSGWSSSRVGLCKKKSNGANPSPITFNVLVNMWATVRSVKFEKMWNNYRTSWNTSWNKRIWIVMVNIHERCCSFSDVVSRWFLRLWTCGDRCSMSTECPEILQRWSIRLGRAKLSTALVLTRLHGLDSRMDDLIGHLCWWTFSWWFFVKDIGKCC